MGTNYYLHKKCSCGEATIGEPIHLGKNSGGWAFSYRGYLYKHYDTDLPAGLEKVECREDWEVLVNLPEYTVVDEYGNIEDKEKFLNWTRKSKGLHHAREILKDPNHVYFSDRMVGGHSFSFHEFS